jgi:hypothetical protein
MPGDRDQGVARGKGIVAVGFEFEEAVGVGTQVVRGDVIGLAMDHSFPCGVTTKSRWHGVIRGPLYIP